jgi:translation elongation factor P
VRFLLADDAGAGKTIMAGLLIRELKLRGLAERVLVICPANLTFQWQRELKEKFEEKFVLLKGDLIREQFGINQWLEMPMGITSNDKFKEPDLQSVRASYLYSYGEGSHFLDQETFETLTLSEQMVGDALDFLVEGAIVELRKYNGNPIGLDLPIFVELKISETGPGVKGDTSSGSVTKSAKLETGLEIRVPLFLKEGEKVKVSTETREFGGRA